MSRATPAELREAIAESLWARARSYELEGVCDRLGMPQGSDAAPSNSKRVYARQRLAGLPAHELQRIATSIVDEYGDPELEAVIARTQGVRDIYGKLQNLIFAALGAKPRIILRDAIANVIEIVEGADRVLIYDRQLGSGGLTWDELVAWWDEGAYVRASGQPGAAGLYRRLQAALDLGPERWFFKAYCSRFKGEGGGRSPALIPQVYLHYDPYTKAELHTIPGRPELVRQRMDFLLLPGDRSRRVVVEIDGKQHYADDDGVASPRRYATMVAEDRRIKLAGYEVFRFGGAELQSDGAVRSAVQPFFDELLQE